MRLIKIAFTVLLPSLAVWFLLFFLNWKFWGGFVTGFFICLVVLGTLGKWQARKAADRIDRIIKASNQ